MEAGPWRLLPGNLRLLSKISTSQQPLFPDSGFFLRGKNYVEIAGFFVPLIHAN